MTKLKASKHDTVKVMHVKLYKLVHQSNHLVEGEALKVNMILRWVEITENCKKQEINATKYVKSEMV